MKNLKFRFITLFILTAIGTENSFADRTLTTRYFDNIAISETDTYDLQQKLAFKIVIQQTRAPTREEIINFNKKTLPPTPVLGKTIWTITPDMLPANKDTCIAAHITPCTTEPNENNEPLLACYNCCVEYGPTFLSYDSKNQKLYLMAPTQEVGQGGGRFLGFVADLKTKTIKYLNVFDGFATGLLSPDNKYILIEGKKGFLDLYNIESNKRKEIESQKVINLKWINNNQYSYEIYNSTEKNKNSLRLVIRNV